MKAPTLSFTLKFIDIMIGIVLGLGFQSWPSLHESWQFIAFIFVYVSIIDYWIDTAPTLKRYPPKRELDLLLDVAMMFTLFLYIYSTTQTITYFFAAFLVFRGMDSFWLVRVLRQYRESSQDRHVFMTWITFNTIEMAVVVVILAIGEMWYIHPMLLVSAFIAIRLASRVLSSIRYRRGFSHENN